MKNLLHQAEIALQDNDYKTAEKLYFQAVQHNYQDAEFWYKLYQLNSNANNFTFALNCLIYVLKLSPLDDFAVNLAVDIFQKLFPIYQVLKTQKL